MGLQNLRVKLEELKREREIRADLLPYQEYLNYPISSFAQALQDGMVTFRKSDQWAVLLHGSVGTGKSTFAVGTLVDVRRRRWDWRRTAKMGRYDPPGQYGAYVASRDIAVLVRGQVGSDEMKERLLSGRQAWLTTPFLVLDDLGSERPTDAVKDEFQQLLEGRYAKRLKTLVVSNLKVAALRKMFGDRVGDRLAEATFLSADGPSLRRDAVDRPIFPITWTAVPPERCFGRGACKEPPNCPFGQHCQAVHVRNGGTGSVRMCLGSLYCQDAKCPLAYPCRKIRDSVDPTQMGDQFVADLLAMLEWLLRDRDREAFGKRFQERQNELLGQLTAVPTIEQKKVIRDRVFADLKAEGLTEPTWSKRPIFH
jgi:DNA replication protein DnaC